MRRLAVQLKQEEQEQLEAHRISEMPTEAAAFEPEADEAGGAAAAMMQASSAGGGDAAGRKREHMRRMAAQLEREEQERMEAHRESESRPSPAAGAAAADDELADVDEARAMAAAGVSRIIMENTKRLKSELMLAASAETLLEQLHDERDRLASRLGEMKETDAVRAAITKSRVIQQAHPILRGMRSENGGGSGELTSV